jgi:hypothetical protein
VVVLVDLESWEVECVRLGVVKAEGMEE